MELNRKKLTREEENLLWLNIGNAIIKEDIKLFKELVKH